MRIRELGIYQLLQFIYLSLVLLSTLCESKNTECKSTPNDAFWPSILKWNKLNETLSGRLLHPSPPASSYHSSHTGSNETCANVKNSWNSFSFHQDNPISTAWNNMNNDSCLPDASAPCSGLGYPVYVVNATSAQHVKLAVDFARDYNVRLNVKASGHDYIKRSSTPYSLSIWTRYMLGEYEYHDQFQPQNCNVIISTTAVTAGAGSYVSDIYYNLDQHNLTTVDGMGPEVTMGGYLTGGGHSPISNIFGLGADQVYEVEMVTPQGEIIVANECQNTDLFWAGGGSSFGVLTKVTVRTVPSTPIAVYELEIEASSSSSAWWDSVSYTLSQFPGLSNSNIASYTYLYPNESAAGIDGEGALFKALFALYDPPSDDTLETLLEPTLRHLNETYANKITITSAATVYPNFYSMFLDNADDSGAGVDKVVGSRLLPPETLVEDAFQNALIEFLGEAGGRLYMVSGKGVWDAKPRGGGNAVNLAWRKALIHAGKFDIARMPSC
ncbi:hypothetical protein N7540_010784 [Penicillium herquei]|nr:hypothetical protein N7540_010784 [Penicillium herquei]